MVVALAFAPIVVMLALITFVIVFQTDLDGAGRPVESLVRARSAVAVPAPFASCEAARAAEASPVYRGDPGYGPHLDGDGDGIGCEPYRP
ncbi:MAG TPA: excalibur calcium-binding domain-containing protein [Allosphingosinicella sp.]|jgi:hypothetical protein|nr:excalibur calcium-binding domain-containing protein [Allosphingosinicella sp.]